MTRLIGEDVDALADVATIRFLHEQLGGDYPISGDLIARHKTFEATASTRKTAEALDGPAVETETLEGNLMDSIVQPRTDMGELLNQIDTTPEGSFLLLIEGDDWYQEPKDVWVRPITELKASAIPDIREDLANGFRYLATFADFYTLDGHPIPREQRDDNWWDAHVEVTGEPTRTPNAIARFGDDAIIVHRGEYYAVAETTLDGEPAIEFWTYDKIADAEVAASKALKAAILRDYPIIEASKPAWAKTISIEPPDEDDGSDGILITYTHDADHVDDVYLMQDAKILDGVFTFTNDPHIQNGFHKIVGPDMAGIADELRALADAITQAVNA